jgi:hypothetical protein
MSLLARICGGLRSNVCLALRAPNISVRKDTKTHQDRWLAIDPDTCALIANYLNETSAALAAVVRAAQ